MNATLMASGQGGPYLDKPVLTYNDPSNPPAAGHWYYNAATGYVISGADCGSS